MQIVNVSLLFGGGLKFLNFINRYVSMLLIIGGGGFWWWSICPLNGFETPWKDHRNTPF